MKLLQGYQKPDRKGGPRNS